jgi:hypothetical protein
MEGTLSTHPQLSSVVRCLDHKQRATKHHYVPGAASHGCHRDTNIEDLIVMIVAELDNMRRNFPSIPAFLPSKRQWVFHFLFSYVFPKLLGVATIRRTKQVTQIKLYAIVIQSLHYLCTNLTRFIFDHIHCSKYLKSCAIRAQFYFIVTQLIRHSCTNVAQFIYSMSHYWVRSIWMETRKFTSLSIF